MTEALKSIEGKLDKIICLLELLVKSQNFQQFTVTESMVFNNKTVCDHKGSYFDSAGWWHCPKCGDSKHELS